MKPLKPKQLAEEILKVLPKETLLDKTEAILNVATSLGIEVDAWDGLFSKRIEFAFNALRKDGFASVPKRNHWFFPKENQMIAIVIAPTPQIIQKPHNEVPNMQIMNNKKVVDFIHTDAYLLSVIAASKPCFGKSYDKENAFCNKPCWFAERCRENSDSYDPTEEPQTPAIPSRLQGVVKNDLIIITMIVDMECDGCGQMVPQNSVSQWNSDKNIVFCATCYDML